MKKSTLSILTALIALSPVAALAQDATSIQTNSNSATAVGNSNLILQNANQASKQQQLNLDAYGVPSTGGGTQTAVQGNANAAAAVGHGNGIVQNADQTSSQGSVDVNQYLPHNYHH